MAKPSGFYTGSLTTAVWLFCWLLFIQGGTDVLRASNTQYKANIDSLLEAMDHNAAKALPIIIKTGEGLYLKGNYEGALVYLSQALQLSNQTNNLPQKLSLLTMLGQVSYSVSDYKQALEYYHQALEAAKNTGKTVTEAQIYSGLSDAYLALGDYNQAYDYQLKALQIRESTNDEIGVAKSYYGLGSVFFEQQHFEQALHYYQSSLGTWKQLNDAPWILTTLTAIGTTYGSMGQSEKALSYDLEALHLANKRNDVTQLPYILHSVGNDYSDLGMYDKALEHFMQALEIEKQAGDLQFEASTLESIGTVYVKGGNYEIALTYLKKALDLAVQIGAKSDIAKINRSIADAYFKLGDTQHAYQYLLQHTVLKDSLLTGEMIDKMQNLQNSYEIEKREKELALLTTQNKVKQLSLYGTMAGAIMLLFLLWQAYGRYKTETKAKELLAEKNAEIEIQNKKLAESNSDLEQFAYVASHDLKEPLRMISSYSSLLNKRYRQVFDETGMEFLHYIADAATRMDNLLTGLLDYSRVNRKFQEYKMVNLDDVVKVVTNNLQSRIRQTDARIYVGKMPVIKTNYTQMVQLFQNLIGNALKFNKTSFVEVIVDCQLQNGEFVFSVKDNGIGINDEDKERIFQVFQRLHTNAEYEGTGIGLSITKKIVERYGGKIWVESTPGQGSTFFFTLPNAITEKTVAEETPELQPAVAPV